MVSTIASFDDEYSKEKAGDLHGRLQFGDLRCNNVIRNVTKIQAGFRMPRTRPRDNLSQDGSHDELHS